MIERMLLQLYTLLLRLYPRQFRQDFAAEMQTVFSDALGAARQDGLWAMLGLYGREARTLPRALAREHWQSGRGEEAGMDKNMRFTDSSEGLASSAGRQAPVHGWGDVLLAAAPFLVILLFDTLPKILVGSGLLTWESPTMRRLSIIQRGILLAGAVLLVIILAWRRKWPAGLATWYPFFGLAPVLLASWLLNVLIEENPNFALSNNLMIYVGLPLVVAVVLYLVTRRDPLRGLLAALPVLYMLWETNMEFVPDLIEVFIKVPSIALISLTVAFLLRRGDWRAGLYAVLVTNLAVGALFSYAGIYYGGTLPFVAPGPNLVEVARSLIPQYLATGAILLGPLFAWKFRQPGQSAGWAGWAGYHLALSGLLLVMLANLTAMSLTLDAPSASAASGRGGEMTAPILLGLGAYLLGLFFLFRDTQFARNTPGWASGWVPRLLLPLLPLAIPVTLMLPLITSRWPVSNLYGIPLLWALPHAVSLSIGMVWLALSVWVVTQGAEAAGPSAAVSQAPEAPALKML